MYFYSASTGGFYNDKIHEVMPGDCVEITKDEYHSLLSGESEGMVISPGDSGKPVLCDRQPLTSEQITTMFKNAIQRHMDEVAISLGYDDIKNSVTYAEEPAVPKFQNEGRALRTWRSLVWAYGYEQISAVQSGDRELPTIEELIAELPALVLP